MDLSIVIPVHNVADTVSEQLDALLAQDWDGTWELVVVDNRSTDSTPDIVRKYVRRSPRIRLVQASEKASWSYACNVGIREARSEAIALCDGDDIVAEGWLSAMGNGLTRHSFVTGPLALERLNSSHLAGIRGRRNGHGPVTFYGIFPFASGGNFGLHRAVWEQVGGFGEDDPSADDMEFSLRAWQHGVRLQWLSGALVHYRYRSSLTSLWQQGFAYGVSRPYICRRLREEGLMAPSPLAGWKSWAWLLINGWRLLSKHRRPGWVWVAANRIGHVRGSIKHRTLFI